MYQPNHFIETDDQAIAQLVDAHPFATWVLAAPDGPVVNHLPIERLAGDGGSSAGSLAGDGGSSPGPLTGATLIGHVARANDAWRLLGADGLASILVFHGPHHYIAPGWYPAKAEHGKVVPTWNYAVVHAHGRMRALDDVQAARTMVDRLTRRHEAGVGPDHMPWSIDDAPDGFIDALLKAIVVVQMTVERVEAKFKLSQNRSAADRDGVHDGLMRIARSDAGAAPAQSVDAAEAAATATLMQHAGQRRG